MAKPSGGVGERLLGRPGARQRPPNTSSPARYVLLLAVAVIGCIYAAPNLYQPDSALQIGTITEIKGTSIIKPIDQVLVDKAVNGLRSAGIIVLDAPGDVLGTRQTGLMEFRIADLQRDAALLPAVKEMAQRMIANNASAIDALVKRWLLNKEAYANA